MPLPRLLPGLASALLLSVLLALPLAGCGSDPGDESPSDAKGSDPAAADEQAGRAAGVPVEAEPVRRGSIARTLRLTGTLEAERHAGVTSRVEGLVQEVLVEVGDEVVAGQELARLERDDVEIDLREARGLLQQAEHQVEQRQVALEESQSQLEKAQSEEERARADRERQESLSQRNLVPEETVEVAQQTHRARVLDVDQAKLAVRRAEIELELERARRDNQEAGLARLELKAARHTITAPMDGVITQVDIEPHDRVMQGQVLFRCMDLSTLVLELRVPESSIALLRRSRSGLANGSGSAPYPATLTTEARPGSTYRGEVSLISPVVDPESGTVLIEVEVARIEDTSDPTAGSSGHADAEPAPGEQAAALSPGMFTSCAIEVERREDVLLVPKRGLIYDEGIPVVFVVGEDGRAVRLPLRGRMGLDDEWSIEVDHPELSEGDQIVVVGQANLKEGSRLTVVE